MLKKTALRWTEANRLMIVAVIAVTASFYGEDLAYGRRFITARADVAFQEDCEDAVIGEVRKARKKILGAIYCFTNRRIARALVEARKNGVYVQIKMDRDQASSEYGKPIVKYLRSGGVSVHTIGMPKHYHMHHKFVVIDDVKVITGSYNFTVAASTVNYENLLILECEQIAARYLREYNRIKTKRRAP